MKKEVKIILLFVLILTLLFATDAMASLDVALSDQGSGVKEKVTGNTLLLADLNVSIWDNLTAGTLLYNEVFSNAIVNGSWNVMLGENSSNPLNLEYGNLYYKDYMIGSEDADFTDINGTVVERMFFRAPLGDINATAIAPNSINETHIDNNANLTLGGKITFAFNEIIDNLINGYIQITGGLNVTKDVHVGENLTVHGGKIELDKTTNEITTLSGGSNITFSFDSLGTVAARLSDQLPPKFEVFGDSEVGANLTVHGGKIELDKTANEITTLSGGSNITFSFDSLGTVVARFSDQLIPKFEVFGNSEMYNLTLRDRLTISAKNAFLDLAPASGGNLTLLFKDQAKFKFTGLGQLGINFENPVDVLHMSGNNVSFQGIAPAAHLRIDMAGGSGGNLVIFNTRIGATDYPHLTFDPITQHTGIGTDTPDANLTVNGAIRLVEQTSMSVVCDATKKGLMFFNDTDNNFMGCDGGAWVQLNN